jgi:hypothetical protein
MRGAGWPSPGVRDKELEAGAALVSKSRTSLKKTACSRIERQPRAGGMAERFKAPVLKFASAAPSPSLSIFSRICLSIPYGTLRNLSYRPVPWAATQLRCKKRSSLFAGRSSLPTVKKNSSMPNQIRPLWPRDSGVTCRVMLESGTVDSQPFPATIGPPRDMDETCHVPSRSKLGRRQ